MKKRFVWIIAFALLLALNFSVAAVFAAESTPMWETSSAGASVTGNETVSNVTGEAGTAVVLNQKGKVNFNEGAYVEFIIVKATDTTIDENARSNGNNYIRFTAVNAQGVGVEMVIYARYSSVSTMVNKMDVDVFYLDPAIEAGNNAVEGKKYLETFETYQRIEDTRHCIDIHKENGMWFFAFDGLTAIPVPALNAMDLSEASLTFEYFSKTNTPSFKLYTAKAGIKKHYIENNLLQFGSDQIEQLADDTVRYKIADQRAAQYAGQQIRYREHLISATGYDVRQPITIEYSYDVSNASAVWYAVGLGRPDVLDSINRLKYDVFGEDKTEVVEDYSDSIAVKNDGIMFQTGTGMAQPTEPSQNNRLESYTTNSASKPYEGRENMDRITFIVKENGTDMYHNGKLIFSDLVTKLSDFESNGYKAYPYFHFFEDVASTSKGNTIVVNGFNVPELTEEDAEYKVVGNSNQDLTVGLKNPGTGAITMLAPDAEGVLQEMDASLYSYDAENQTLTIKYSWFDGKAYDIYKLYASNGDGSAEISVRYSDPDLATLPPTVEKDSYFWKTGSGTEDLVVKVDIHNGIWKSFSGAGIMTNNYKAELEADGSTVYVITISKDFLNNKKAGTYTFTVRTTDVEEGSYSCQFKVTVGESESGGGTEEPDDKPENPDGGEPQKGGCSSAIGVGSIVAAALALGAAAVLLLRKKVR